MSVCSSLAVNFNAPHKKIISYYTNIILCKFVINFFAFSSIDVRIYLQKK